MVNLLPEKTEAPMDLGSLMQFIDKIEECFASLEIMLYEFKIKKMNQIKRSAAKLVKANKNQRLGYYREIFSPDEFAGVIRDFSLKHQEVLQNKNFSWDLDLYGLNKTEEILQELNFTDFLQKGSNELHAYAWGKIISSSGLPAITHKYLKRAVVKNLANLENTFSRQLWLEVSLSGLVENCITDIKRQIKEKIILEFYKYQNSSQKLNKEKMRKIS